jgi:hypothetical protein
MAGLDPAIHGRRIRRRVKPEGDEWRLSVSDAALSMVLIWGGVGALLGLMAYRFARGAWSLEDEDIPAVSSLHRVLAWLAVLAAAAGLVLFVRDWHGMG